MNGSILIDVPESFLQASVIKWTWRHCFCVPVDLGNVVWTTCTNKRSTSPSVNWRATDINIQHLAFDVQWSGGNTRCSNVGAGVFTDMFSYTPGRNRVNQLGCWPTILRHGTAWSRLDKTMATGDPDGSPEETLTLAGHTQLLSCTLVPWWTRGLSILCSCLGVIHRHISELCSSTHVSVSTMLTCCAAVAARRKLDAALPRHAHCVALARHLPLARRSCTVCQRDSCKKGGNCTQCAGSRWKT